jgi:hypothetical protein
VQHLAIRWNGHRARDLRGAIDVLARDLAPRPAHGDGAARIHRLDVVTTDAHDGRFDAVAGQPLSRLARRGDRRDRLVDVDDHALLDARRRDRALADDGHRAIARHLTDERHDFVRAHVERD